MDDKFFLDLREKVKEYLVGDSAHEIDHTDRVYSMALKISEGESFDEEILKAALLLHDIASVKQNKGEIKCHAEEGAKMAKELLEKTDFPRDKIERVCYAIRIHRKSHGIKAETQEAKILQDADRLDALGAMVISRVFALNDINKRKIYIQNGNKDNSSLHFLKERILILKPETFNTKKAREIAKQRYDYVRDYVERFEKELKGEI